jgi:hypothetical protein
MPLPLMRYLRLQLGRLLFGPGHFAPYLLREHLGSKCLNAVNPKSEIRNPKEIRESKSEIQNEKGKERYVHAAA